MFFVEGIEMGVVKLDSRRVFLARAEHDSDIIKFLTDVAKKHGITVATFTAIGAVKSAKLGFYDQQKHEYHEHLLTAPQEIASCIGNISLKEGEPFVHAHAILSDINGNSKAGHLLEGKVFAAEIHLVELVGEKIERKNDAVTGLALWDI
jgi:predicted DNA-binding protein with PD1-like motif